jgi:RimK family alpha-L-glutamate ligase
MFKIFSAIILLLQSYLLFMLGIEFCFKGVFIKKNSLLILCVEPQYEVNRIIEEAQRKGWKAVAKKPSETSEKELECFSHLLLRAIKGGALQAKRIAEKALKQGIKVTDEKIALGEGKNKLKHYFLFKKSGLNVPKTIAFTPENIDKALDFAGEKVVVKDVRGKRGQEVHAVKKEELQKFLKKTDSGKKFLVQEMLSIKKEVRVLVIGKNVLGAYEKQSEKWVKNISAGGKGKATEPKKEICDIALKATRLTHTEIAGVDLALAQGKWFVLEVNRSPGFREFEKVTGKNAAREIVEYLERK